MEVPLGTVCRGEKKGHNTKESQSNAVLMQGKVHYVVPHFGPPSREIWMSKGYIRVGN
jgi:hypothetical protein